MAREKLTQADGTRINFVYTYDSSGFLTGWESSFAASGNLQAKFTNTWVGGLLKSTTWRYGDGSLIATEEYDYDGTLLLGSIMRSEKGEIEARYEDVFANGLKTSTLRYSASRALEQRWEFQYDSETGHRTGAAIYDASGKLIGSTTRSYSGDVYTGIRCEKNGEVDLYEFSYEDGPLAFDPDVYSRI